MVFAWACERTARYAFKNSKFSISLPTPHLDLPFTNMVIRNAQYDPRTMRFVINGELNTAPAKNMLVSNIDNGTLSTETDGRHARYGGGERAS
jgi:hypothetical protein